MEFNTLLFDVQAGIAHISLNRPEAANSISIEMAKELMRAAMECDESPAIRAVLISGQGSMFCAGGDLREFTSQGDNMAYHLKKITTYLHMAVSYMARMNPPVITAVHGSAAGAGMGLVCGSDIVIAAESTKFTLAYTGIGLSPDGGSTYNLPRLVGLRRAIELALTNRSLTAEEALEWGIVNRIAPDNELMKEAKAVAQQLALGPTRAFGATKRLMISGLIESLEGQLNKESRCIAEMSRTEDAKEGIGAFLKKRNPHYTGK